MTPTTTDGGTPHGLAPTETPVRIPETVPEFLEATRPPTTRRGRGLVLTFVFMIAAIMIGAALLITQPWDTTTDIVYIGDWKDLVTEAPAQTYTGDWKDTIVEEPAQPYTGDWKDVVSGASVDTYTGDWKDTISS